MASAQKRLVLGLSFVVAVAAGLAGFYRVAPSSFMKLATAKPVPETLVLSGRADRGRVLDAGGGWFNGGKLTEILIRSERIEGRWERPDGVVIRNGKLRGAIRVIGLGRNGEAEGVRLSSTSAGHTERAQAAAPVGIVISGLEIEAARAIPVYLGPGVTGATVENCTFTGWSVTGAVYLDAESAGNTIRGNRFDLTCHREVVSVDGSARNLIEANHFSRPEHGGIYLYRNCGEGGTVRHLTPRENTIRANRFRLASLGWLSHAVWIGSRNGGRPYCGSDAGHPFGSSLDDRDFADDNRLEGNSFDPPLDRAVRNDGKGNVILP